MNPDSPRTREDGESVLVPTGVLNALLGLATPAKHAAKSIAESTGFMVFGHGYQRLISPISDIIGAINRGVRLEKIFFPDIVAGAISSRHNRFENISSLNRALLKCTDMCDVMEVLMRNSELRLPSGHIISVTFNDFVYGSHVCIGLGIDTSRNAIDNISAIMETNRYIRQLKLDGRIDAKTKITRMICREQ
jgi:hypothetical protein